MNKRIFWYGVAMWIAGTVALRVAGQYVLRPGHVKATLILFAVSFPLMAWIARRLCAKFQLSPEQRLAGGFSLALPTLLLDPFSSAFFPVVFPNIAPEAAGLFGGWMLWCCAAALIGSSVGK